MPTHFDRNRKPKMMPISQAPMRRSVPRHPTQSLAKHRVRRLAPPRSIQDCETLNAGAERADAIQSIMPPAFRSTTTSATALPLPPLSRRAALLASLSFAAAAATATVASPRALAFLSSSRAVSAVSIVTSLRPDPLSYDASDPRLREAANALQLALNAESLEDEERLWTEVITRFEPFLNNVSSASDDKEPYSDSAPAPWAPEIVSRAYGNRGNARVRAGRADEALKDLDRAIELAPWAVDPVLNRGVVLENSGRLEEAARDYRAVIEATGGKDASPFNNLGNVFILEATKLEATGNEADATKARQIYRDAAASFGKAVALAPSFSFAAANRAVALFAAGDDDAAALKELKRLNRRFPNFDEARAAAAGILWSKGERAEAEGEWSRVDDPRYKDTKWLVGERHWPPRLVEAATALLEVRAVR